MWYQETGKNDVMFYPAHLNLQNRKCLVVGAGLVAERKVLSLLRSGGDVTLISPDGTKQIESLTQTGWLRWHKREFDSGDTAGMFLVCAATDQPETNTQVFKEAHEIHGINLVNVVDVVPECTFAAASIITYEGLTISISTSGKSPAMSRRIREHLEAKFEVASLYTDTSNADFIPPPRSQGLLYPVYFLLEDRRCLVINRLANMREGLAQRVDLLQRCGACVEQIDSTVVHRDCLSDAFLVLINDIESDRSADLANVLNPSPLIEHINTPQRGTFTTPLLVDDGNLVIGISTNRLPEDNETAEAWNRIHRVQIELVQQFENNGYGAFIDFLGSLRALVMHAIPTQVRRQRFFDNLIDQLPGTQTQECCLGFENIACSIECAFNLIRDGQIERAHQWANQRIGDSHNLLRIAPYASRTT